jgi:hypothetical protein
MNPRTIAARSAPLFPVADESQIPETGFSVEFQDLYSYAMDQALGVQKESLVPVVGVNSCLLDIYKKALWLTPTFGNHLDMAQALGLSMEVQMSWLALLVRHVTSHVSTVVSSSGCRDRMTPDELAYSMDIALGERFTAPGSTVASSSGSPAQPKAEELAQSMDVVIGERFAAPGSPANTPIRKRRVGERYGDRHRGAGGRLDLSYGSRKAHG